MAEWLCCSKKRCLPNHKCCGLGFYSPCYILFPTCKSPKSQSPCGVPTLWGLYRESLRTSWGLLRNSLGTGRTSAKLGLIPKESLGTPQGLLGDSLVTPQQHVAQCNDLPWGNKMREYLISVKNLTEESLNEICDQAKQSTQKAEWSRVTVCQRRSKALGPACLTRLSWCLWVHPSIPNTCFIPFYRSRNDTMSQCDHSRPAARPHHHLVSSLLLVAQPIHIRLLCHIVSLSQNCLAVTTSCHDVSSCFVVMTSCHNCHVISLCSFSAYFISLYFVSQNLLKFP